MFIISLTYKVEIAKIEEYMDAHKAYLQAQYDAGHFIASGRKVPRTGGIILARSESLETLEPILAADPFHLHKLADYEITEFMPTMVSDDFRSLLGV
ncbi:YciI family protein [Tolumonas lignilytica]|jgi:Uncharacterized protein conserved in bacteria|uniref:YciI family protein n=1 Tax=Tolumonas lignilytica TaxID=1283284 RepID=UPI000465A655|nr:YciI family protein [Tolumonas lignilytica]